MAAPASERIDDLEDGECSESDGESSAQILPQLPEIDASRHKHRSQIPQIVIHSDESSNDSDEECPSLHKRSRNPFFQRDSQHHQGSTFVNPLLANNYTSQRHQQGQPKRRNNIWSSVISEQVLTNDVKSIGVDNPRIKFDERDVESYDFTKAKDDERPALEINPDDGNKDDIFGGVVDLEQEVKRHESRKRKRNAKERLGKRGYDKNKIRKLAVTEGCDIPEVVKAIADGLNEPKVDLVTRIVETVGTSHAIRLYYMTEDVEDAGGMLVKNGTRRRTPGGVYIELLKSDANISAEAITSIFEEEEKEWKRQQNERRKIKKAARRKWKKKQEQTRSKHMDLDHPTSPSVEAEEDLEVLNVLGTSNDIDGSDFPERPATPEPKDDSSDGQGRDRYEDEDDDEEEDDDEDDDISVAIAKAKSAIMRKQKELSKKAECGESEMDDEGTLVVGPGGDCAGEMAVE